MTRDRTHELKVYAGSHHEHARFGDLIMHLWFVGGHVMELDLDIALHRPDVAYVDVIDCVKHTTERLYPGADRAALRKSGGKKQKA